MFDQNQLHELGIKGRKDVRQSLIHSHRCRFCGKNYYFFSHGKYCKEHSWRVLGNELRLACICQKGCDVLKKLDPIILPTNSNNIYNKTWYICCKCYEDHGDHLYIRPGRGKKAIHYNETDNHLGEVAASLELIANWILQVSHNGKPEFQEKLLAAIIPALQQLDLDSTQKLFNDSNELQTENLLISEKNNNLKILSLFLIKLIFKLYHIDLNENPIQFDSKNCYSFRNELAESLLKNYQHLHNNKIFLENPRSLDEYQNAILIQLYKLFEGIVGKLLLNQCQIANKVAKSRKEKYIPKEVNQKKVQKISTMLSSIILTIGFTNTPFWLTQSLASLCQKPRLLSSLHRVLESVSVISHSISHERKLETSRMSIANPQTWIIIEPKIWNVYVIDNIDFKQSSFA